MLKKWLPALLCVLGLVFIVFSNYIQMEVNQGKADIHSAQSTVNKGKSLFSLNSSTKQVGNTLFSGAQKKIDEGQAEVGKYESIAAFLQIIALLLIFSGIGLFGYRLFKRYR